VTQKSILGRQTGSKPIAFWEHPKLEKEEITEQVMKIISVNMDRRLEGDLSGIPLISKK